MSLPTNAVQSALLADPEEGCRRLLDALRHRFGGEEAALVRAGVGGIPAIEYASPGFGAVDLAVITPALQSPGAFEASQRDLSLLVLGLRIPEKPPCCLVLFRRAGRPWEPAAREKLLQASPFLTLAITHLLLRRQLGAANAREAVAVGGRERLLAAVSHELRNPLAPILMWTSALKRLRSNDPEVVRATEAIEHAVALERRLLESLNDMSRMERGGVELRREAVDLREVVAEQVRLHRIDIEQARLSVMEELPAAPVLVHGDRGRLGQIAGHLIGNAVKFTPPGGRVAVEVRAVEGTAQLRITDTGPGLPEDVAARLFVPFTQGPNARGGFGLGLAIAHWLVELHGGTITVGLDRERGGTVAVVTLPMLAAEPARQAVN